LQLVLRNDVGLDLVHQDSARFYARNHVGPRRIQVGDTTHVLHVIGNGDPVPGRVDVPRLFGDLDPALTSLYELLVVRHPGIQESIGFAFDQVPVDGPDAVGEL
jgi:hypothetical protein